MSETLIKIEFNSRTGDLGYRERMIQAGSVAVNVAPFEGAGANHTRFENGAAGEVVGQKAILPGGAWRIGIGLKGFRVAGNVCRSLAESVGAKGVMSGNMMMSTCGGGRMMSGK